jgi:hypothetical protein
MVSSPQPEVVANHMVGKDLDHCLGLHLYFERIVFTAHASEDIVDEARVASISERHTILAPHEQRFRTGFSCLKNDSSQAHTWSVDLHRCVTACRHQRGQSDSKNHLIRHVQLKSLLEVVHSGGEDHVQALL